VTTSIDRWCQATNRVDAWEGLLAIKVLFRLAVLLGSVLAGTGLVHGEEAKGRNLIVELAGRTLSFPTPPGFCPFRDGNAFERDFTRSMHQAMKQLTIRIILLFGNCHDLGKLRKSGRHPISSYGNYVVALTPEGAVVVLPPGVDRVDFVRSQVAEYQNFDVAGVMTLASRAAAELGVKIDHARVGIIESSTDVAYLATYTAARADTGFAGPVAGITAITAIRGIPVFASFSRPLKGTSTYEALLADAKIAIGKVISANIGVAN
jgi:hypothetical protein